MMFSFLLILAPLAVMAQEPGAASTNGDRHSRTVADDRSTPDARVSTDGEQQPTRAQPPPPDDRRRRGSKVGYIDDAVIESKLRFRFDAGFQNTVPDRAEFFYAKCGCYKDAGADPDAPGPRPGAASDLNFQQLYVWAEYALTDRFSAFGHVPVRWIQPQSFVDRSTGNRPGFSDQGGLGDLRVGVKLGFVASDDQSVTAQAQLYFPTGAASRGLGTNHASIEPALLYYRRMSDVVVLESQAGIWLPFGGSSAIPGDIEGDFSGNVLFYGVGSSFEIYRSDPVQFAPVMELVGWRVTSGFQTLPGGDPVRTLRADGTNIVNLKIGARILVDRGSFYIGYGHALTDATWYDDIVRFEYRFSF